ncbi:alpha/beta hydrolase [Pseudodonghicola flavimaris]|uniref:Alpha/beta fold hydrolase n=1 Tax=Pseudodonghicola flavimaris TaxID=3050036 RepID=A0ABT7EZS0_9RHOB|nr:alpha/beta fold hydrolase [Pseudodonghicola flavimaris]MDK3017843.1 alpha/beta fold hydrolase [Pseudodonghicola flavimaris]
MDRRQMMLMLGAGGVSACTDRFHAPLQPEAASIGSIREVFVATQRVPDPGGWFTTARSDQTHYLDLGVSIPPDRQRGQIRNGFDRPDPHRDFAIATRRDLADRHAFRRDLARALQQSPADSREIVLYIHGYNNSFFDGVFRTAQMGYDFNLPAVTVHYAWPSATHPLGYTYDRDSVLFSRDGLEQLLYDLKAANPRRILLVAHSLGTMLLMETLRQIEIARPGWSKATLGGVVLISPDLDIEVFRMQAQRFRALPQPFAIFTSNRDKALALSARINGAAARLGNMTDPEELADLPVLLIDVSEFGARGNNHFTVGTSPALISLLNNSALLDSAFQSDRSARSGLLPGTVLTVRNTTQMILSPNLLRAPTL